MDRITKIGVVLLWTLTLAALAVGCGDVLPPTVPENLVVNAVSASEIDVSWDASEARTDIKEYRVYRDGSLYKVTNATSFDDTGLMNSTEYCYQVRAVDSDDNRSDKTDKECATTLNVDDSANPTAPTNLIATVVNSAQIDLAWTPSTDDTGVAHYNVYRNSIFINSPITNTYSDTGLTNSTNYCYIVNAVDTVGKSSISSNQACGTTGP